MANVKKYHTKYYWTFMERPDDLTTIPSSEWVTMDGQKTVGTDSKGNQIKKYFNQVLNDASSAGKYFVMTETFDNTQVDGSAYQVYGTSGKMPIIMSLRTSESASVSTDQYNYLT